MPLEVGLPPGAYEPTATGSGPPSARNRRVDGSRTGAGGSSPGEAGEADPDPLRHLVARVEADEERRDRLHDPRVRERAAVEGAQPRHERAEGHDPLARRRGTRHDDVA